MATKKRPLEVHCFQCQKEFIIKYVVGHKSYSRKNDWYYWTEQEENQDKKICNQCLKSLYEAKWDYYELFSTKKKALFRVYLVSGKFA
ncbi:MAG: hypothetical protein mread185_000356 [Mycoplasmataceae bacterium]|nr:MAG: hypothetical protein mread185_000356 [Mycoplasmataceae bacterium]